MKKLIILTLVFAYVTSINGFDHLLHCVTDEVLTGSYNYYSFMYDGQIKIQLVTQSGDSDLYISQITTKPTYELDQHCMQSTTCGEDNVYIPQSFKRPINVGIYGHPSHRLSRYTLLVYKVVETAEEIDKLNNTKTDAQKIFNQIKKYINSYLDSFEQQDDILLSVLLSIF